MVFKTQNGLRFLPVNVWENTGWTKNLYADVLFGNYSTWARSMLRNINAILSQFPLKHLKLLVSFWDDWKGPYEVLFSSLEHLDILAQKAY